MIIDFHTHPHFCDWMPGEDRTTPRAAPDTLNRLSRRLHDAPPGMMPFEMFLAEKRAAGIDRIIIFHKNDTSTTGEPSHNGWVFDLAASYPDDFIAFMALDPHAGSQAVSEFETALRTGRARGGKIHPYDAGIPPNDRRFYEFYEVAAAAAAPIVFHSGPGGSGAGTTTAGIEVSHPRHLADLASDVPTLRVVIAHFAGPFFWEAHSLVWRFENFYADISGYPLVFLQELPWRLFERTIPEQILLGSDYPIMTPAKRLADLQALPLRDDTREAIAGANAARLLSLRTAAKPLPAGARHVW
jgi:uncharacterized protein